MKIKQKDVDTTGEFIPVKITLKTEAEAKWFHAMLLEMTYGHNAKASCQAFGLNIDSLRDAEEELSWLVDLSDVGFTITLEK